MAASASEHVLIAPENATSWHVAMGRKLLGAVEDAMQLAGILTYSMRKQLADGSTVAASVTNGVRKVVIALPPNPQQSVLGCKPLVGTVKAPIGVSLPFVNGAYRLQYVALIPFETTIYFVYSGAVAAYDTITRQVTMQTAATTWEPTQLNPNGGYAYRNAAGKIRLVLQNSPHQFVDPASSSTFFEYEVGTGWVEQYAAKFADGTPLTYPVLQGTPPMSNAAKALWTQDNVCAVAWDNGSGRHYSVLYDFRARAWGRIYQSDAEDAHYSIPGCLSGSAYLLGANTYPDGNNVTLENKARIESPGAKTTAHRDQANAVVAVEGHVGQICSWFYVANGNWNYSSNTLVQRGGMAPTSDIREYDLTSGAERVLCTIPWTDPVDQGMWSRFVVTPKTAYLFYPNGASWNVMEVT